MKAARFWCSAWWILALLVACGDGSEGGSRPPAGGADGPPDLTRANILLLSLDTCRADVLGYAGGPDGISERLDALAAESVVFTEARAPSPQTAPSHMTLFTSTQPSVHGVQNVQHGEHPKTGERRPLIQPLPAVIPTLAEVLKANGYRTLGLTDGGNVNPGHGFDRGFDEYTKELSGAEAQVDDALSRLDDLQGSDEPWFLFLHTYEIHAPYVSPREYIERWAPADYDGPLVDIVGQLEGLDFQGRFGAMRTTFWARKDDYGPAEARYMRGLYEAGVEYTDDHLTRLFAGLQSHGVFDDTIVVVLSDHGEEFLEHGAWQHDQLFEECLRVPLMFRLPGAFGGNRRVDVPVGLIDVMPTLLELVGARTTGLSIGGETRSAVNQGRSLASTLLGGKDPQPRPVFSEYRADRKFADGAPGPLYDWQVAIHHQGMKFIYDEHRSNAAKGVERRLLFDLAADPGEQSDLSAAGGKAEEAVQRFMVLRKAYHDELVRYSDIERVVGDGGLDAASLDQLEQLGYLGGEEDGSDDVEARKDGR